MIGSTWWTAFCLAKPRPLGGTAPSIWLNHPIYRGVPGLQALHVHTKYTAGVQLCVGVSFHPNPQIGAVYSHAEAIQVLRWEQEALPRGGTPPRAPPCVHFSAGGTPKKWIFLPKVCSMYLVIFTCLDLFLRELCFFKYVDTLTTCPQKFLAVKSTPMVIYAIMQNYPRIKSIIWRIQTR